MSAEYWLIRGEQELETRLGFLAGHLKEKGVWPIRLDIKKHTNPRSLSHNALFWMWMSQLETYFTGKGRQCTKDDMHDLMCHKFLGYEHRVIGQTEIHKLRGTKRLDAGEFQRLMEQVDHWAVDHGCRLTYPDMSEYNRLREAQEQ